ncbi:glutathione peroxidase [Vogesella mureinivorans]|jgi:glutathione peroxidase|uniref:glutathione peroxidase n=1 Tax=Vogesella mureinivorans TaxID=657276 RepID=UPI0011C94A70|nr:glutathione peroxidase [Vogesella mureinivorans]
MTPRLALLCLAAPLAALAACPPLLNHQVPALMGGKINLCDYSGKAVVVVNTASQCGFTPQYKGLQSVWKSYQAKGAVVVGFPSDDFNQELAKDAEVAQFCESNFGVSFPMASRVHVRGSDAHPFYQALAEASGTTPKWNFYKYIISADGKTVTAFSSLTKPDSPDFIKALNAALPR